MDALTITVTEAIDRAADDRIADGCACPLWGLHRAQEIVEEGIQWAE